MLAYTWYICKDCLYTYKKADRPSSVSDTFMGYLGLNVFIIYVFKFKIYI